jgi:oligopeptide transport system substrate-binding protein
MRIANRATGNHPLARCYFGGKQARPAGGGFHFNRPAKNHSRWRKLLFSFFIVHFAFLLTGCFRTEPPADITICNANEPESLDPHIVTGISEMRITKALFDGVTKLDPQHAAPIPALAERWEISPDGRTYTFYLRTNAVWSTGEPITSADVVWSWFRALSPLTAGDYAGQLFYIRNAERWYNGVVTNRADVGIRAPDDYTVQVELNAPIAFFLELCAFPTLAVVPRHVIEKYGDRWLHAQPLPTSGAFMLGAWRVNDKVRLLRNPLYWDAANTPSQIIDVLPTGSPNTALNLYETGVADIIWDKDLVPTELMDVLGQRPDFHSFTYLGTYFYRFNVTRPPFNDVRVRRAFALATDKARIISKLTKGGERPAEHFVPLGVANYKSPAAPGFDPKRAKQLLAEAGFPGGQGFPRMTYTFFSAAGGGAKLHGKVGVELQQMWRDVLGVEIELRQIERKVFYSSQSKLDYDISTSSWIGDYNDANTFLDMFMSNSGNNRTGWANARYDTLIREANQETNLEKRAEIFRQAETLLIAEDVPIVPLYFYAGFNFYDDTKVGGIWQNILDEHPMQYIYKKSRGAKVGEAQIELKISQSLLTSAATNQR